MVSTGESLQLIEEMEYCSLEKQPLFRMHKDLSKHIMLSSTDREN